MTSMRNQALEALPNVLQNQTIPNTLGGLGPSSPPARPRLPAGALVAAVAVILAVALMLAVLAILP